MNGARIRPCLRHINFSRQRSCILDLSFYVSVQVFYDLPHSTPYTQFREQFVQNSVYPDCIKDFQNIKKAAENLATNNLTKKPARKFGLKIKKKSQLNFTF